MTKQSETHRWSISPDRPPHRIRIGSIQLSNIDPIVFIAGLNVLDHQEINTRVADVLCEVTSRFNVPLIFKASYDNNEGI